ncbi:MAG: AI-2E family transporter, partial [Flammeovirgaceae bacterium]
RKQIPFLVSLLGIGIPSLGALSLAGLIFYRTGQRLVKKKEELLGQIEVKLTQVLNWLHQLPGMEEILKDVITSADMIEKVEPLFSVDWLVSSYNSVVGVVGNFTGLFFMTLLYFIVLLSGILKYEQYLHYLEEGSKRMRILQAFEQVKQSVVTYMKVKVLISFLTGLGYWLICLFFEIEFALFWGFLAFILNFIPTFGSIIATIPPLLLGMVMLDSFSSLGFLLLALFSVQITMGNIVEPKLMGEQLSLNTITVLLGLLFWGYLWGITGMILSMPLLVLVKVILSQLPEATVLVRLMGTAPSNYQEEEAVE